MSDFDGIHFLNKLMHLIGILLLITFFPQPFGLTTTIGIIIGGILYSTDLEEPR